MTSLLAATFVSFAVAVLVGWALPWLAMRMLVPSLEESGRAVRNYRGAPVVTGLGIVWLVWAVLVLVVLLKVAMMGALFSELDAGAWGWWAVPAILVVAAFAFGLVDDAYGASDAKGFRGHIAAMLHGRLTTGGLKLVGIGLASVVAAFVARSSRLMASDSWWTLPLSAVVGTLVIALSANLVNLTDLRPGRAIKAYVLLVVLAMPGLMAWALAGASVEESAPGWALPAIAVPLLLGPALAVWRYDLGERAMLGDAGANAMGALAGYVFAATLPLWGLAIAAAVLFALNLLSEKVSFSKVIEGNAVLRWIDGLGRAHRPALETDNEGGHADAGSAAPSVQRHEADTRKDGAQ